GLRGLRPAPVGGPAQRNRDGATEGTDDREDGRAVRLQRSERRVDQPPRHGTGELPMGLREDLERYREVGEERREDLAEFIQYGNLGGSGPDSVRIPVKIIDLPGFEYDKRDRGGVGQGDGDTPEPGQPVGEPQPGDEDGEAGEEGGDHEYYEMDPEEFAQELDERLGLDLEPKGKRVVEEIEGEYTDVSRTGPNSTL